MLLATMKLKKTQKVKALFLKSQPFLHRFQSHQTANCRATAAASASSPPPAEDSASCAHLPPRDGWQTASADDAALLTKLYYAEGIVIHGYFITEQSALST